MTSMFDVEIAYTIAPNMKTVTHAHIGVVRSV